jgi:hypothetical protein
MNYSIYSEPLFPVRNRANGKELLSLQEIIGRDDLLGLDYPMQLINVFARFLLAGLLEAALSNKKVPLDENTWNTLVNNQPWPEECVQAIKNPPDGFNLFGDVAFLQIPNEIFEEKDQKKPIEQLLQPFQVSGDTTKGLRQGGERVNGLCPSCALIGLYAQHFYTAAVSKYWSTSAVNNALLFSPVLLNGSLRATLALHLINADRHGYMVDKKQLSQESFKTMPWVPDNFSAVRLAPNHPLPLEKWLNPEQQRGHLADAWLPFIRAVRLTYEEVDHAGKCDFCGNLISPQQIRVNGFYAKDEQAVFEKISEQVKEIYIEKTALYKAKFKTKDEEKNGKQPSAFTFNRLYRQELRHPALAYRNINGEKARLLAEGFKNNYTNCKPHWAELFAITDEDIPILLKQLTDVKDNRSKIGIEIAGLGYKKGRDIDSVTNSTYSFDLLEPVFKEIQESSNEKLAQPLRRHSNNVFTYIEELNKKIKEEKKAGINTISSVDIEETNQRVKTELNCINEIKDALLKKDYFNKNELIQKADEIEHTVNEFNAKFSATEKLEEKPIQALSTAINNIYKEIQQVHEHYAKALIAHVHAIINALQEAGDVLSKKTEAEFDNKKQPYKIIAAKKTDNLLTRTPQFLAMADALWKQSFKCLITIAEQKDKAKKQDTLFNEKQRLSNIGRELLQQYLDQFPPNFTELAACFLENKALTTYNEKVYGKKTHDRKSLKKR